MKPKVVAAPPAPPSLLDEQQRTLRENMREKENRRGYGAAVLTDGMRLGLPSQARLTPVRNVGGQS